MDVEKKEMHMSCFTTATRGGKNDHGHLLLAFALILCLNPRALETTKGLRICCTTTLTFYLSTLSVQFNIKAAS